MYSWCKIDGTTYSAAVASTQRITNAGIVLFTRTMDIPHSANGSKMLTCSAWINLNTPLTSSEQSFSRMLTTIPRVSSVSGGSGNIGGTTTINITRASSSFTHILYWQQGTNGWNTIASNIGTIHTWTIPTSFYARIPNANSGTGTIHCETYSGSTYIWHSSTSFTFNVTNSNPTFTANQLTYQDTNTGITSITGNNQLIIRNRSSLSFTFTAAAAQNSATISRYESIFNGVTTNRTAAGTFSIGTVNSSQNLTLQVRAIDSRGNTTTISRTVTILDWVPPIINATAIRINNFESQTTLRANVQISSVQNINAIETLQYRAVRSGETSWSSWVSFSSHTNTTVVLDNLFAWDLQVRCLDKFGETSQNLAVPKGMPIMFFDTKKLSVGVNCFPQRSNSFEINGRNVFDMIWPVGAIYMSVSSVNPSVFLVEHGLHVEPVEFLFV